MLTVLCSAVLLTSCGTQVVSTQDPGGSLPVGPLAILQPSEEDTFAMNSPIPVLFGVRNPDPKNTHIKVIVDEKPAQLIPLDATLRMDIRGLVEGSHIIRAYLVDDNGIYHDDQPSFTYRNFNVEEDNNLWSILPTETLVTINSPQPKEVIKGPTVPVQGILRNYQFGPQGGFVKFWYSKEGGEETAGRLKTPEPVMLELEPGNYFIRFQLFDWNGNQIDSNWTWQNTEFVVE